MEESRYIVQTSDSGYIVAGLAQSNDSQVTGNHGAYDTWLVKLSPTGAITWQKAYGGSASDNCNYVQQTADGGYIFGSSSKSSDGDVSLNHGSFDFWIVKLNPTGGITWQKSFGGSGVDAVHCVKQTADGGYIACGRTHSTDGDVTGNHGDDDVWVIRLSDTGGVIWKKCYGGTGDDDGGVIMEMPDGSFMIGGASTSNDGDVTGNHGGDDYWVVKVSATGTLIWQKSLGGSGIDQISSHSGGSAGLQLTADGGVIVSGWSNSTDGDVTGNHGDYDFWVVKLSGTGSLQWQKSFGGTQDDEATSLDKTADGGYIVAGTTYSNDGDVSGSNGWYDYWVVKISDTGALQWQKCMGGSDASPGECANAVHATMGGGYILTGYTSSNDSDVSGNHGDIDYWVVKLNCIMPEVGPIGGPSNVCVGATITLSDTAAAGSWNSSTGKASVVAAGVITGITAGTDVISYSVVNTCGADIATHTITINPLPVPVITASGSVLSTTVSFTTYQWLSGTTPISGATGATYTAITSGSYRVIVTDANGCSDTSAAQNLIPAAVNNLTNDMAVSIVPNPTTGELTILGENIASIKVYNSVGQLIKESAMPIISLTGFPEGLYYAEALNGNGMILGRSKIIKN